MREYHRKILDQDPAIRTWEGDQSLMDQINSFSEEHGLEILNVESIDGYDGRFIKLEAQKHVNTVTPGGYRAYYKKPLLS